jgi:hypothetical protein
VPNFIGILSTQSAALNREKINNMDITCNGIRKHGTHALLKAVELLGCPVAYQGQPGANLHHKPFIEEVTGKHIFIRRHPKNAFISLLRMHNIPLTTGMLISKMQSFEDENYVQHCDSYLGWLSDANALNIKFEDLMTDGGVTFQVIADYLNVPYLEDAYPNRFGLTATWSGELSDYTSLQAWTNAAQAAWVSIGGDQLEQDLGY